MSLFVLLALLIALAILAPLAGYDSRDTDAERLAWWRPTA